MADGHGGARTGAGRKAKAEKYEPLITPIEDRLADNLPHIIDNLEELADGGYERVKKKFEPAGLIFVLGILRNDHGDPMRDQNGDPITGKLRAFPDLPADEMVCVEMTTETADYDRAANIYLADRILGKPTQAMELSGPDGNPISLKADVDELRKLDPDELVRRYRAALGSSA